MPLFHVLLPVLFLGSATLAAPLRVLAAVSTCPVLAELSPDAQLQCDASGRVVSWAQAGRSFDILVTADEAWMQKAFAAGLVRPPSFLAQNSLVLVTRKGGPVLRSVADLATSAVRRLGLAAENVPLGSAAREVLAKSGLESALSTKTVSATNAAQVLAWVRRGDVDAAIVYGSDANRWSSELTVVTRFDPALHHPLRVSAAVSTQAAPATTQAVERWSKASEKWSRAGFSLVEEVRDARVRP